MDSTAIQYDEAYVATSLKNGKHYNANNETIHFIGFLDSQRFDGDDEFKNVDGQSGSEYSWVPLTDLSCLLP